MAAKRTHRSPRLLSCLEHLLGHDAHPVACVCASVLALTVEAGAFAYGAVTGERTMSGPPTLYDWFYAASFVVIALSVWATTAMLLGT